MVFHGAAAVLGRELGLEEPKNLADADALAVLVVVVLFVPVGVADVGHAERLSAAEQHLATVDRAAAPLRTRSRAASVVDVAVFVQVQAVDLHRRTGEQRVAAVAGLGVAQVLHVGRVELELRHRHRRQEDVEGFLAALLADTANVVVLGVSLQGNQHFPGRGVIGGQVSRRTVEDQARGLVPAEGTLRSRRLHVGGEFEVLQVRTDTHATVVVHGVSHTRHGQESDLVDTIRGPVSQLVTRLLAERDDGLLVGHAAFVVVGVTHLVDTDHLIVRLQTLFVALQGAITNHTVAFHVGNQGDHGASALLRLLQLGDVLDDGVFGLAEEFVDEGQISSLAPEIHAPGRFLLVGEQTEVCDSHLALLAN